MQGSDNRQPTADLLHGYPVSQRADLVQHSISDPAGHQPSRWQRTGFPEGNQKGSDPIPVILLTANDTDLDIVNGLELGADDYITKPFSLAVLRARVNTQLRKTTPCDKKNVITIDDYSFDFSTMEFSIRNKKVELSKTEQKLLRLLIENRGTVMSRSALVDRIWTDGAEYVDENALSVTVKRLRDKLKAHSYIKTIYGIGYSWVNEP